MAGLDNIGHHPLSLKVMRVSRPSLAAHWQPFFSSSPSLSAHSTASPLSLQGAEPLAGHPKTLRDLTNASNVLMLPAAFGAIQLGETFSSVLSVNNEAGVPVDSVRVKVEMQTATSKATLAEISANSEDGNVESATGTLMSGDSLELCVATEIKELGQHVLACTVTYRTPPGMRPATSGSDSSDDPFMQSFRKFYKFMVTNPLSVKTKVHVPKSPSALLSRNERDKVFLEVHIQNLTQGPLWFENTHLEPVDGWEDIDANIMKPSPTTSISEDAEQKSIFSDSMAIMHPQDMRQYIYILTPKVLPRSTAVPVPPTPGTVIPLGRLDISWRSSMGEPGRLLTSVLSRRIPLPPPPSSGVAPASALPPYLQKSVVPHPSRPRSPSLQQQVQQQRTVTPPPQRPGSPLKRATTPGAHGRPLSPGANAPPLPMLPGQNQPRRDVEVDLVLLEMPKDAAVYIEEPFSLRFSLAISATLPLNESALLEDISPQRLRVITLAVQLTQPVPPPAPQQNSIASPTPVPSRSLKKRTSTTLSFDTTGSGMHSPLSHAGSIDVLTPRRVMSPPPNTASTNAPVPSSSGGDSIVMSPTSTAARNAETVTVGGLSERLRRVALSEALGLQEGNTEVAFGDGDDALGTAGVRLPSIYSKSSKSGNQVVNGIANGCVQFMGTSAVFLPPITLSMANDVGLSSAGRGEGKVEFNLTFLPRTTGFARIGGLRVLLVKDEEKVEGGDGADDVTLHTPGDVQASEAQILHEWDTIAEVWVRVR